MSKTILKEESQLYNAFVAPFNNALKAGKLLSQELISATLFIVPAAFAITPEGLKKHKDKYDKRAADLDKEWEPIVKANQEAMQNSDFGIVAFTYAPGLLALDKVAQDAYEATGDVYDYLEGAGLTVPLMNLLPGVKATEGQTARVGGGTAGPAGSAAAAAASADKETSILTKLRQIFFAHYAVQGDVLVEQEEKEAEDTQDDSGQKKIPPLKVALKQFMQDTGLEDVFKEKRDEIYERQKEYVEGIMGGELNAENKFNGLLMIASATTAEEFEKAIDEAQRLGLEGLKGASGLAAKFEESSKELAQSEEYIAGLKEKSGVEEVTPEMALTAAKKTAFIKSAAEIHEQLAELAEQNYDVVSTTLEDVMSEAERTQVAKTPEGKKLVALVQEPLDKIADYNKQIQAKVGSASIPEE